MLFDFIYMWNMIEKKQKLAHIYICKEYVDS